MQTESIKGASNLFYYNINRLMREHGYSQSEFADAIGRPRSSINIYVNGKRFPGPEVLQEFADFFRVSPAELFKSPEELANDAKRSVGTWKNHMLGYTSDPDATIQAITEFVKKNGAASFCLTVNSDAFQPYASRGDVLQCNFAQNVAEGKMVLVLREHAFVMGRIYPSGNQYILLSESKVAAPMILTEKELKNSLVAVVVSCNHTF